MERGRRHRSQQNTQGGHIASTLSGNRSQQNPHGGIWTTPHNMHMTTAYRSVCAPSLVSGTPAHSPLVYSPRAGTKRRKEKRRKNLACLRTLLLRTLRTASELASKYFLSLCVHLSCCSSRGPVRSQIPAFTWDPEISTANSTVSTKRILLQSFDEIKYPFSFSPLPLSRLPPPL